MKTIRLFLAIIIIICLAVSVTQVIGKSQISFAASSNVQNFMNMTEGERVQAAKNMTQEEKQMVMNEFSKQNSTVSENMSTAMKNNTKPLMGNFVGSGDGFHKVEGLAKVLTLADGKTFLRLANLKATNGPDLYVYLSTGK